MFFNSCRFRNNFWAYLVLIFTLFLISCTPGQKSLGEDPPSHKMWSDLLKKHVKTDGLVDYQGFILDSALLNSYLITLNNTHPDFKSWSDEERLAYWINAYNAFTIKLIIDNYPLNSIKDLNPTVSVPFINSVWDKPIIQIQEFTYSLNDIEHKILRKRFEEPRIHFAINCASKSCPNLRSEAYFPDILYDQLEEQSILFLNDTSKNYVSHEEIRISKIFLWFNGDFTNDGSIIEFINRYSSVKADQEAKIRYLKYDWSLNE